MKRLSNRIVSLLLILCLMVAAAPLGVYAATNDRVIYYTDDSGNRTGIKQITLGPNTYYDCSGNKSAKIDARYLTSVIGSTTQLEDKTSVNILGRWANIAGAIFELNDEYTCTHDYSTYYGKHRDNDSNEMCDVADVLASSSSRANGALGKDNYRSTGLSVADSLSSVRNKMGEEIARGIDSGNCTANDILGQGDNCDDALPELKDTTNQTVIYNMVTSTSRKGLTFKYDYNAYGVAFYDFDLEIISDDNIEYVTDAEYLKDTDNPVESAADSGVEGFSYTNSSDTSLVFGNENYSTIDATKEFTLTNTNTDTITSSVQNSETYTFSQMIGSETEFDSTLKGIIGGVTETLQIQFTCQEAYSSVLTEETSKSVTTGSTDTTSCVLPAQTVGYIKQDHGVTSMTVPYDLPVALTFKVMIFSMSGDVYADGGGVLAFSTVGYEQSYFSTTFGGSDTIEGTTAYESLYNRYSNKDINGWDSAYGNNHIYYKYHDGSSDPTDSTNYNLNWSSIERLYQSNTGTKIKIDEIATRIPMLSCGASTTVTKESYSSVIYDFLPMYLPVSVRATNLNDVQLRLFTGDSFPMSRIELNAFNKNGVPYYGFKPTDGHWEICDDSTDVLDFDQSSNSIYAKSTGTGRVQWVLNDDVEYTAEKESGIVTKNEIPALVVVFTIRNYPLSQTTGQ